MNSSSSGSGSAPNSARSGSSESSGYHSRLYMERLSTRRKEVSSTSLTKAPSRSSSSLTSHEADFQAWKKRKEYKPFNSSTRYIIYFLKNNPITIIFTRPSLTQRSAYSQRQNHQILPTSNP